MTTGSPIAFVSPDAVVGEGVTVGHFAIIEAGVRVGAGCVIESGAVLKTGTVLGERVHVHSHAVIGGLPQDYVFDKTAPTGVEIGDDTIVRECVTVNRATKAGTVTRVGRNCMLMACCHVAHDCVIGDHVVLANGALLGGHVTVGDRAFVSGGVTVHQFNRIGPGAMISSNASITLDAPPFSMISERNGLIGFNLVGLRRAGVSRVNIAELKRAWRAVYDRDSPNVGDNARRALDSGDYLGDQAKCFILFLAEPGRRAGHCRPRSESTQVNEA